MLSTTTRKDSLSGNLAGREDAAGARLRATVHSEYKATFWIEAGRKESLEGDFVHLYQTLKGVQMVSWRETVNVESAVIGVKSWFSGRQGPWLMVFDGRRCNRN
jgi:hypothetical protein